MVVDDSSGRGEQDSHAVEEWKLKERMMRIEGLVCMCLYVEWKASLWFCDKLQIVFMQQLFHISCIFNMISHILKPINWKPITKKGCSYKLIQKSDGF